MVFNGNQTGRANNITLDQLALGFWGFNGTSYSLFWSTVTTLPFNTILSNQSGQGGDGYGYALDPTEAAAVQTHLTGYSLANIYLGGGFSAGCDGTHFSGCSAPAKAGADDLKVAKILAPTSVPEPVSILGFGTILLLLGSRLRRNRA